LLVYLAKYIAQAGVCSRRNAVELVKDGVVQVNGKTIVDPAQLVTPDDNVTVSGKSIAVEQHKYVLLNKPKNCITTSSDENERFCVNDIIKDSISERLHSIGRLDRDTTGVLLLTNDGSLTQRLAHPSFEVTKVYKVTLDRSLRRNHALELIEGVRLDDGLIAVDKLSTGDNAKVVIVELHSGKNRVIRRLFEELGYEVRQLDRTHFAGLTCDGVAKGQWRFLTADEVGRL
jgi:23S rRNA pseudouridine2605 synthase